MSECNICNQTGKLCNKCYNHKRYLLKREEILKRNKLWRKKNLGHRQEYEKQYSLEWRKNNKERIKKWHKDNQKKINEYCKNRRKIMPHLKVNANISRNISHSLKGNKSGNHWENLVGYTLKKLISHLEKKFQNGMTWNNYGKGGWHIDHIIPKSHFNITDENCDDFKKCWAIKNLQPLWEHENCSKGNKFVG